MAGSLYKRAAQAARPYLPPFCTITEGGEMPDMDWNTLEMKRVLFVRFTFPGATGTGFWRSDRRDLAVVDQDDYETYQQLKEKWQQEQEHDQ